MIKKDTKLADLTVHELEEIIGNRVRLEMRYMTEHIHQELNKFGEQMKADSTFDGKLILTSKTVERMLDVTNTTLWHWHQDGVLKNFKVGKKVFYFYEDILNAKEYRKTIGKRAKE